jgi:hypothetical protein
MLRSRSAWTLSLPLLGCASAPGLDDSQADSGSEVTDECSMGEFDGSSSESGDPCGVEPGCAPWLVLTQAGIPIADGDAIVIQCGSQGSYMIPLEVRMGGFETDQFALPLHITFDVEGYNTDERGYFDHFDYNILIGCCVNPEMNGQCYGDPMRLWFYPPDTVADASVLHELPATVRISLTTSEGVLEETLDVELWALATEDSWYYCD